MSDVNELQNLADDENTEAGYTNPVEVEPGKSTASIVC